MKRLLQYTLLIGVILSLSACKEITKHEIINDLKMTESLLPMPVDEQTICVDMYYNKLANEITIKYVTRDSCQNEHLQRANFVELIQNNQQNQIIKLLKRCATADLDIHSITYSTHGDTLVNTTMKPDEYHPKHNKKKNS